MEQEPQSDWLEGHGCSPQTHPLFLDRGTSSWLSARPCPLLSSLSGRAKSQPPLLTLQGGRKLRGKVEETGTEAKWLHQGWPDLELRAQHRCSPPLPWRSAVQRLPPHWCQDPTHPRLSLPNSYGLPSTSVGTNLQFFGFLNVGFRLSQILQGLD